MNKSIDFGKKRNISLGGNKNLVENKSLSGNKNFGGIEPVDMINSGMKVFDKILGVTNTIIEEKSKTQRLRIETDRIRIESNERLKNLEIDLKKYILNKNMELEVYKEDIKVKLKNIDKEMEDNKGIHETRQLKLRLEHEVNMKLIDEQGRILDRVLDIYSKYYDAILSGNELAISPDFIFRDMQNCINTLKHSISVMSGQSKIIDAELIE